MLRNEAAVGWFLQKGGCYFLQFREKVEETATDINETIANQFKSMLGLFYCIILLFYSFKHGIDNFKLI